MALVCFAVALTTWTRQRLQLLVIPPIMYILVVSLVAGSIYPERVIELGEDISQKSAWHGITHFKNQFGMTASIGIILCFHHWLSGGRRAFWAIAGIAAGVACLIFSRSNTSQLATMICMVFMVLVMRVPVVRQRYTTHVVVGIAVTLLLYQLVIQDVIPGVHFLLSPIANLMGKDTTFSSRTVIWQLIKDHIHAAPFLGTGYGAYWVGPFVTSPSIIFRYLLFFYPSEAHNGYLDIVNDLGLVGLTCLLAFIFWFLRQGLQFMRIDRSQAAMYLALLFQQMVMNMSESEWLSRSSTCVVLLLAATCLARGLLEHRKQVQSIPTTPRG
jgi:exopolysaccharide production protein ExoQ